MILEGSSWELGFREGDALRVVDKTGLFELTDFKLQGSSPFPPPEISSGTDTGLGCFPWLVTFALFEGSRGRWAGLSEHAPTGLATRFLSLYGSSAFSAAPCPFSRCALRLRLPAARRKSLASARSASLRYLRTSASDRVQKTSRTSVLNRKRLSQRRSSCWVVGTNFIRRILIAF